MTDPVTEARRGRHLARLPSPTKLIGAAGATGTFTVSSIRSVVLRGTRPDPHVPVLTRLTPGLLASVFGEEVMLKTAGTVDDREVDPATLRRRSRETDSALNLLSARGMLDDPASYHRTPEAPNAFDLEQRQVGRIRYRRLSFNSGYRPLDGMPGTARWTSAGPNQRCYASVLEHRGEPRPWLVWLHPYGMGRPMDLLFTRALKYHCELGFNVLLPVLPMHGPRRVGGDGGDRLLSLDWMDNIHALTQTVWDVRRCLAWIRGRDAVSISVHGMSLGGYAAALVAGLEELDCAVIGVATATLHEPLAAACTRNPRVRRAMARHGLLGDRIDALHKVVTPIALPCQVRHDRRFIYAGLADRVAPPSGSRRLWDHWDRPAIFWSPTSHVTTLTSAKVRRFVREALEPGAWPSAAGPVPRTPPPLPNSYAS